jgi:hypothetical protein
VIIADTGAVLALIDADDRHHETMRTLFEDGDSPWVLPWAILPEIDYLLSAHVGARAEEAFLADLASGVFLVEWGTEADLLAAVRLCRRHRTLRLGLVDSVVIAVAERLKADAIATIDIRHFGAVKIRGGPKLIPRDL